MARVDEVGIALAKTLEELAHYIQPFFPYHAEALFNEVVEKKMTNERWHKIRSILASVIAVPGVPLTGMEHDRRNLMLAFKVLAQDMAIATFKQPSDFILDGIMKYKDELIAEAT